MQDKPLVMSVWYSVVDYTHKGCLNCGKYYCDVKKENLEEYFDSKTCMQHEPTAEHFRIDIKDEDIKEKILQVLKENGYVSIS